MSNKKHHIITFLLLIAGYLSHSQTYSISGFMKDTRTGEVLVGANVFIKEINNGTTTNNYGFYSISVPTGKYSINYSYVGYLDSTLILELDTNKNIDMSLSILSMRGAVVRANSNISKDVGMSRIDIPIQQINKIPAIMGEVDVIKAIQLLPGVKGGNEGSSGLYVRGGSPDQNLILLDGVPVYNVNHLFGFFSVFNSDAINNIQLYKGGFPSRYGGRLSSIIDIGMKEGNKEKLHGNFSISPIAGRFSIDGPLSADGKTTFAFSFRRTWIDLLTRPFTTEEARFGYYFYDLNAKVSHQISRKERIFFSVYKGEDKFYSKSRFVDRSGSSTTTSTSNASLGWGNSTAVIRYYKLINRNFFSNYALSYTSYRYKLGLNFDFKQTTDTSTDQFYLNFDYGAGIRDYSLRSDYELSTDSRHKIRFGGIYTLHTFAPGTINIALKATPNFDFDTTIGPKKRILSHELAGYIEDEYMLNYSLKALYGMRLVSYVADGKARFFVEPRLSLRQMLQNNTAIKFSYTLMNQPIHLLTNNGLGLPVDIWVPATSKIRPQMAQQIAFGITQPWKKNIEFSIEWYYKKMNHVIDYSEGADFSDVQVNWENKVKAGKGESYGMELLLQKKAGRASGWLGYTLAWSNRTIKGINFDKTYPIKFDRRHQFTAVFSYEIDKKFSFQATFIVSSGNAITFPQGKFYTADGYTAYDYGSKNASRMPAYHRLDLGLINKLKPNNTSRTYEESLSFSVYNFYNQFNPYYLDIQNRNGNSSVVGYQYFGFLPTIAYNLKF